MPTCACMQHICAGYTLTPEKGIGCHGSGGTNSCESPYGAWELYPGTLQEQQVLIPAEWSLQLLLDFQNHFFFRVLLPSSENWSIFILKIYLICNLVHEGSLCTWMRAYRCLQSPEEGGGSPKARVTGDSQPPNLSAKNWTQVPWRTASSFNHRALPLAQEPTHF